MNIIPQLNLFEVFEQLVLYMYKNLERFGEILMVDGKAIDSFATRSELVSNESTEE